MAPGSKVGIYEVVELIGVGGMGEVYRAKDSRLDRAVAIKTLPDEFAADPDRLARFEREAKVLAQLNHPHIASIYGIEPGTPVALAMEMAEGETLAHRIQSGPLPIEDVLTIARQVAEALEHAHAKNIVHRDLKPANIKVGPRDSDPHVKVLDFGLAKAMSADAGVSGSHAVSSPTITSPANLTRIGVVLGTAAYMAPEQARGRNVDHRADIWAFGCVLFEMLTGRRPFEGDEVADVLSRVLQIEPDWSLLPPDTPPVLRTLLRRCLRKDAHQRVHSIADVRIELDELESGVSSAVQPSVTAARRPAWLPALAGLAVGAAAVMLLLGFRTSRATVEAAPVLRFSVSPPDGWTFFRPAVNGRVQIALSPNGEHLAAVLTRRNAERQIFVRRLSDIAFIAIPGTEGATTLFWAPDNARIAFGLGNEVREVELSGGGSRQMATLAGFVSGSWSGKDVIAAATSQGGPIHYWPVNAGQPMPAGPVPQGVIGRLLPRWLADEYGFMFIDSFGNNRWMLRRQQPGASPVDVMSVESFGSGSVAFDYRDGCLMLCRTEASGRTVLTAQKFDLATSRPVGEPTLLATDVSVAFAASDNGLLAFGENRRFQQHLVWIDELGQVKGEVTTAVERMTNFDLSHDGRFVAVQHAGGLSVHDIQRGVTTQLNMPGSDPIWSPDDREIAYWNLGGNPAGIAAIPAFGGTPRILYPYADPLYPEDWSSDGKWLAAIIKGEALLIPLGGAREPIKLVSNAAGASIDETRFSPDGQWLAFGVNRGAPSNEVFLTAMPPTGERWQLSVGSGAQPRWRADGRAIYYLSMTGTMMLVDVDFAGGRPHISRPHELMPTAIAVEPTLDQYAPTSDRNRFLLRLPAADQSNAASDDVQVIVNWPGLLKTNGVRQE